MKLTVRRCRRRPPAGGLVVDSPQDEGVSPSLALVSLRGVKRRSNLGMVQCGQTNA